MPNYIVTWTPRPGFDDHLEHCAQGFRSLQSARIFCRDLKATSRDSAPIIHDVRNGVDRLEK